MQLFEYYLEQTTYNNHPFDKCIDYVLYVPCENRPDVLEYVFRSYKYGDWLYITDIFPRIFADDSNCFKRFTSHEGYLVNMRCLALTCLHIFVQEIMALEPLSVLVISGSYEIGEKEQGASRKLKVYRYLFRSVLHKFNLRVFEMLDSNAFMIVKENSPLTDAEIKTKYLEFKKIR